MVHAELVIVAVATGAAIGADTGVVVDTEVAVGTGLESERDAALDNEAALGAGFASEVGVGTATVAGAAEGIVCAKILERHFA